MFLEIIKRKFGELSMPVITVEGPIKSVDEKRKLVELLTKAMKEAYGYPEEFSHITVIINENSSDNIGTNGKLLTDIR